MIRDLLRPGGPPEANINSKSAFKRVLNLEKACTRLPWDVLEKKRAVFHVFVIIVWCTIA